MKPQSGFVIAAVDGKEILRYYDGNGEWTDHDNAHVYFTRGALRSGKEEAKGYLCHLTEKSVDLVAFGVYVS